MVSVMVVKNAKGIIWEPCEYRFQIFLWRSYVDVIACEHSYQHDTYIRSKRTYWHSSRIASVERDPQFPCHTNFDLCFVNREMWKMSEVGPTPIYCDVGTRSVVKRGMNSMQNREACCNRTESAYRRHAGARCQVAGSKGSVTEVESKGQRQATALVDYKVAFIS